jgi:hypothetical protein
MAKDRKNSMVFIYLSCLSTIHCKKRLAVFLFPARMSQTKLSLAGIIKLFLAMESLVRDIPAVGMKTANLFYSVGSESAYLLIKLTSPE